MQRFDGWISQLDFFFSRRGCGSRRSHDRRYSGGVINYNLVQWKPAKNQMHYETGEPVIDQVTIIESSRFDYPTLVDPVQSETINLAHFLIDDDLKTKWWSAIDEMEAWIEIDLGNPAVRITDDDSRWFFLWKYQDQIDVTMSSAYGASFAGLQPLP